MSEQKYRTDYFRGCISDDGMREFLPFTQAEKDVDPQPVVGENAQVVEVAVTYHTIRKAAYIFPADWSHEQIARNLEAGFVYVGQFEVHDQETRFVSNVEAGYSHGEWTFRVLHGGEVPLPEGPS